MLKVWDSSFQELSGQRFEGWELKKRQTVLVTLKFSAQQVSPVVEMQMPF